MEENGILSDGRREFHVCVRGRPEYDVRVARLQRHTDDYICYKSDAINDKPVVYGPNGVVLTLDELEEEILASGDNKVDRVQVYGKESFEVENLVSLLRKRMVVERIKDGSNPPHVNTPLGRMSLREFAGMHLQDLHT